MPKGIIMEKGKNKAVVMTQDGAFQKVRMEHRQHLSIGDEIELPVKFEKKFRKTPLLSISAAAVIFIFLIANYAFSIQNSQVAAFVTIDINPSIEASINKNMEVIELTPLNKDATGIINQLSDYKGKPMDEVISQAVELSKVNGYLQENKDILITTSTYENNKDEQLSKSLNNKVEKIKETIKGTDVAIQSLQASEKEHKAAKESGLSTGKYLLYIKSKEKGTISIEEAKELSVTKIYEKIEKNENPKEEEKNEWRKGKRELPKLKEEHKKDKKEKKDKKDRDKLENNQPYKKELKDQDRERKNKEEDKRKQTKYNENKPSKPNKNKEKDESEKKGHRQKQEANPNKGNHHKSFEEEKVNNSNRNNKMEKHRNKEGFKDEKHNKVGKDKDKD